MQHLSRFAFVATIAAVTPFSPVTSAQGIHAQPEDVDVGRDEYALRDPDGANLDRIQVVKGWLGPDGNAQERIFDIAVSDQREIGADGRGPTPVGDTVDVADASYTNTIGDAAPGGFWQDSDFAPDQAAFYYIRVLEIPTPSWIAHDEEIFGSEAPAQAVRTQQERAYSSPTWYTPLDR